MLDKFSKDFADALFAKFPEWRDAASVEQDGDGREFLQVQVARPVDDDPVGGLTISTEDEEVTVACGRHWHSHFSGDFSAHLLSDVFEFIDEVLEEEQVFARFQNGDRVIGGRQVDAATARALLEKGPAPEPFHPRHPVVPDTVSLWSWRGTFDGTVRR